MNLPLYLTDAIASSEWVINAIGVIKQKSLNKDRLWVNKDFPIWLQKAARRYNCKVIQIATDCIYNGAIGGYNEVCMPSPTDAYGFSKQKGEIKADNFYNIRCSIVGPEPVGSYSLLGWFLSQPLNSTIPGYINHIWNGVTTLHFAKVCRGIIEYEPVLPNLQHLVPANSLSKYELLRLFASAFRRDDITIEPTMADENIDRSLSTVNKIKNTELWVNAGYGKAPTIEFMVHELARWKG